MDTGSPVVGREETAWCAVTGGRGFMARHLVAALIRSGEWRVRITDLAAAAALEPAEEEGLLGAALRDGRAVYARADVCDPAQLTKAFEGVDVVFHTAAADPAKNNFQLHYKVNVEGTKNVIDACKTCKVKRLIYTSSSGVVFDGVHDLFGVDESMPYPDKFADAYAQTKAEAEKLVMRANEMSDLLTCCLRPGSIFGPGGILVPYLLSYARTMANNNGGHKTLITTYAIPVYLRGLTPWFVKVFFKCILGDGNNWDDFVYVENVVHGHLCAERTLSTKEGAKSSGGKAYFITNLEPVNMWDFIYMVLEELGYKSRFKIRVPKYVLMPIAYVVEWSYNKVFSRHGIPAPQLITSARIKYATLNRTFSCNKAMEELGYKPIVSLKEGVKITCEFSKRLRA